MDVITGTGQKKGVDGANGAPNPKEEILFLFDCGASCRGFLLFPLCDGSSLELFLSFFLMN